MLYCWPLVKYFKICYVVDFFLFFSSYSSPLSLLGSELQNICSGAAANIWLPRVLSVIRNNKLSTPMWPCRGNQISAILACTLDVFLAELWLSVNVLLSHFFSCMYCTEDKLLPVCVCVCVWVILKSVLIY